MHNRLRCAATAVDVEVAARDGVAGQRTVAFRVPRGLRGLTRGRIIDRRVTTVDILPTIADVLGVRLPWKTDGSDRADSPVASIAIVPR